jgi:hypothetical protein
VSHRDRSAAKAKRARVQKWWIDKSISITTKQ